MISGTDGHAKSSMNQASTKDPFNNNSYGTLVDQGYRLVSLPVLLTKGPRWNTHASIGTPVTVLP